MKNPSRLLFAVVLAVAPLVVAVEKAPAFQPEQLEFFEQKIRPILAEQCFQCHSATGEKIKGGLVMDSRAAMLKGGDTGPGVVIGDPDKSLIIQAIRYHDDDLQMPPKHRLTAEQVMDFEEWVRMGVPDPRAAPAPAAKPSVDMEEARKFWSFQPVKAPPVPAVKDAAWARNDLDRFLLANLEARGLKPNPDATPRTLIRRATYDLTGLPPTPEEVENFAKACADGPPSTIHHHLSTLLDRLLASPAYGERWGRHWLDLVRYADTSGCNSDFPIPSAYRYRNWVIDAFNRDKPYDQFLREQIAGDLLPASSTEDRFEKVIATGYLAIARRFGSRAKEFHLTLEDLLDNLGKTTLGLSVGCARCHDHKFDPILAKDYYALYGIFRSTTFAFPGTEIYPATKDFTPLLADPAQAARRLADAHECAGLDDKIENLKNEKKKLAREEKKAQEAVANASDIKQASNAAADAPEKPPRTSEDAARDLEAAKARQDELRKNADAYPKAYAVMEGTPANAPLQRKGEPGHPGEEIPRGFLTILGGQQLPADEQGSGRRELADWIADPANPLTARVMVNRIWQHHFGRGLVRTPNDFGVRGERPTHPELLDYLAARFISGSATQPSTLNSQPPTAWSMKSLHREIMLSRAYQMSSDHHAQNAAQDVNNDSFWRFDRRRLSAEELRDSLLAVAGTLDRQPGGPHPFKAEREWQYTQHKPFVGEFETRKRSVYLMQQRFRKNPFLELFDGADPNAPTAVRAVAQTPIQALWFLNSKLAHEQTTKLAEKIASTFSDEPARLGYAFALLFGRPASPDEIAQAQHYLRDCETALKDAQIPEPQRPRAALASLTRVLLSSNEFHFVE